MKSFLKIITCAAFISITSVSFAQTQESVKTDKATEMVAKIDRAAHLTDEQKPKVTELAKEYIRQVDQLRADESTFADKKKVLTANYQAKLKEVLTEEQFASVEKMMSEKK